MFVKSDAIIIGRRPFSNTSLVLRCYTRRAGLFRVTAKGVFRRRRKAEPPSVPDLFARGEVVLHVRPPGDYAILREWTLEDMRAGLRGDYDAFRAASGCAALVAALGREGDRPGELFGPLDRTLGELDGGAAPDSTSGALMRRAARAVKLNDAPDSTSGALMRRGSARQALWAFALRALIRTGFLAPLDACASCGAAFAPVRVGAPDSTSGALMGRAAGLSPEAGGLVCARCRRGGAGEEGRGGDLAEAAPSLLALSPEAAAAARFLANSHSGAASRLKVSPRASASLERAVRSLAEYVLERPMPVLSPE